MGEVFMSGRPIAIDLFSGLGGWAEGLEAEGWDVIRFDIEDMFAATGTPKPPNCLLVLQDVLTIHGSQLKSAQLIVASPPCQEFSYMAMPWSLAKDKAAAIRADETGEAHKRLTALFDACFRIQREAREAAGRHIPMVIENVKGAQPWVGRSRWAYGSFHLWGDVPALMPRTQRYGPGDAVKRSGRTMCFPAGSANPDAVRGRSGELHWQGESDNGRKNSGGSWFNIGSPGQLVTGANPVHGLSGTKVPGMNSSNYGKPDYKAVAFNDEAVRQGREGVKGSDGYERDHPQAFGWKKPGTSSKSSARKAASAKIAKIPFALSSHIGRTYFPRDQA